MGTVSSSNTVPINSFISAEREAASRPCIKVVSSPGHQTQAERSASVGDTPAVGVDGDADVPAAVGGVLVDKIAPGLCRRGRQRDGDKAALCDRRKGLAFFPAGQKKQGEQG